MEKLTNKKNNNNNFNSSFIKHRLCLRKKQNNINLIKTKFFNYKLKHENINIENNNNNNNNNNLDNQIEYIINSYFDNVEFNNKENIILSEFSICMNNNVKCLSLNIKDIICLLYKDNNNNDNNVITLIESLFNYYYYNNNKNSDYNKYISLLILLGILKMLNKNVYNNNIKHKSFTALNNSSLYTIYINILEDLKCKYILLENFLKDTNYNIKENIYIVRFVNNILDFFNNLILLYDNCSDNKSINEDLPMFLKSIIISDFLVILSNKYAINILISINAKLLKMDFAYSSSSSSSVEIDQILYFLFNLSLLINYYLSDIKTKDKSMVNNFNYNNINNESFTYLHKLTNSILHVLVNVFIFNNEDLNIDFYTMYFEDYLLLIKYMLKNVFILKEKECKFDVKHLCINNNNNNNNNNNINITDNSIIFYSYTLNSITLLLDKVYTFKSIYDIDNHIISLTEFINTTIEIHNEYDKFLLTNLDSYISYLYINLKNYFNQDQNILCIKIITSLTKLFLSLSNISNVIDISTNVNILKTYENYIILINNFNSKVYVVKSTKKSDNNIRNSLIKALFDMEIISINFKYNILKKSTLLINNIDDNAKYNIEKEFYFINNQLLNLYNYCCNFTNIIDIKIVNNTIEIILSFLIEENNLEVINLIVINNNKTVNKFTTVLMKILSSTYDVNILNNCLNWYDMLLKYYISNYYNLYIDSIFNILFVEDSNIVKTLKIISNYENKELKECSNNILNNYYLKIIDKQD